LGRRRFFFWLKFVSTRGKTKGFWFFFAQIHEHVWEEEEDDSYITTCGEFSHCGDRKNEKLKYFVANA
jgi:hypothetical protein